MASADKSRLPSSFDGETCRTRWSPPGGKIATGAKEAEGRRRKRLCHCQTGSTCASQQRENGKERGRQRATAQNSKESSFSRSARVVREVEDSPAFFHGCRRQISDAAAVKISRLPRSVREKNLRAAGTENERPRQSVRVRAEGRGKIMMAQQLDDDRRGFTLPHQE